MTNTKNGSKQGMVPYPLQQKKHSLHTGSHKAPSAAVGQAGWGFCTQYSHGAKDCTVL